MRSAGIFESAADAERFASALTLAEIDCRIDTDEQGRPEVWIVREEDVSQARALRARFRDHPTAPEFQVDPKVLRAKEEGERRAQATRAPTRYVDVRTQVWGNATAGGQTWSLALIGMSVLVFLLSLGEGGKALLPHLFYSYPGDTGFAALRDGQLWRLVTPIFIHGGILHIVFNMMWVKDLGASIEAHSGSRFFVTFVLVVAVVSNTAQYLTSGASFGGMSGVVYGFLGYVWMRSRYDSTSRYALPDVSAITMLVWYFLCVFGLIGGIANMAHGMGLIVGMVWGLWKAARWRMLQVLLRSGRAGYWILAVLCVALPSAYIADRF